MIGMEIKTRTSSFHCRTFPRLSQVPFSILPQFHCSFANHLCASGKFATISRLVLLGALAASSLNKHFTADAF
jgi:hypothetical protein